MYRLHTRRQFVRGLGLSGLAGLYLAAGCAPPSATPARTQAGPAPAAPTERPLTRVRVAWAEPTPGQAPTWLAQQAGLYARHGLDVELSFVASAQTVPAVIAGEIDVALGGGYAAMSSRLAGSDLMIFYATTGFYPYEFMVAPAIATAADLRGQKVGISRFGSSSDVATRIALQHLGLDAERDVVYIQIGSLPERIAALYGGSIVAGLAGVPDATRLRKAGFKSLLDLGDLSESAMINMAFASESWMRANDAAVQGFVNAWIEGVHYAKTHRAETERVIAEYVKIEDPAELAESYEYHIVRHLPRVGHVDVEEGRKYLLSQIPTDPRAAGARAEEFFDPSYTQRPEVSALVARLYGGS